MEFSFFFFEKKAWPTNTGTAAASANVQSLKCVENFKTISWKLKTYVIFHSHAHNENIQYSGLTHPVEITNRKILIVIRTSTWLAWNDYFLFHRFSFCIVMFLVEKTHIIFFKPFVGFIKSDLSYEVKSCWMMICEKQLYIMVYISLSLDLT